MIFDETSCDLDAIKRIAEKLTIPVIANGGSRDIERYKDILQFRDDCNTSSVMIARAAEWNVSVFRKEGIKLTRYPLFFIIGLHFDLYLQIHVGKLPLDEVLGEFLKLCIDYDEVPNTAKYCVQMMLRSLQETPRGKKFLECQTLDEIWYVNHILLTLVFVKECLQSVHHY